MKENQNSSIQIALWVSIAIVTAGAFFGTYFYQLVGPLKALLWLVWLVVTLALGYYTNQGQKAWQFAREAKAELDKVVWPTRPETIQTTSIVMVMVAVTGFLLWGVDSLMLWVISKLTHLG